MPRKTPAQTVGGGGNTVDLNYRTKEAVGRHINRLRINKGMTQAELARNSGLTKDSISTYIRGKVAPTPLSAQKLARVFNVPSDEFIVDPLAHAILSSRTLVDIRESEDEPGMVHIRMDRLVPRAVAAKISALVFGDDSAD